MSTCTLAALFGFGTMLHLPVVDNMIPAADGLQADAVPLTTSFHRCTKAAASGSFILPRVLSGEAEGPIVLVNDSGSTVVVFCAAGEKLNGTLNQSVSVATGLFAVFMPVPNVMPPNATVVGPDWRSATATTV